MEESGYRVVFEKGGVFLHTSARGRHQDPGSLIAGVLRLLEKDNDVILHWAPLEEAGDSSHVVFSRKEPGGGDPCPSEEEPTFDPGYEPDWAVISTVRSRPRPPEPAPSAGSGSSRGPWAFSVSLGELKSIRRSKPGLGWAYLVLVTQSGGSLPALHFHRGGTRALLRVLSRYLLLASSPQDSRLYLVFPHDSSALCNSFHHLQLFDDDSSNLVSRFLQDPYAATFGGFSRVTNFFRGALQPPHDGPPPGRPEAPDDEEPEPGFEVISCVELGPRPVVSRGQPVTEDVWARHVGPDGQLQDVEGLKAQIFSGGLCPALRREAWKFLLGYLSWEGSAEEHKAHVRRKTDEYFRMKLQWKSVSPEQERRNSLLHGYRSLIERDVSRTDRSNKFYEGPGNPGLGLLNDILLTYCMYHFDLGYVQGMSDLLSPILYVTQNEVDAFWCFCGFMELVHGNFEESQETMKRQLGQLLLLLRVLDPPLCDFLDSQDSGSLCFCFRWLLIWFKREFPFPDVLRLWEVLWTGLPGPNMHLLVACAILDMERDALMLSGFGSNEILKHINELTMKLSVEDVLTRAQALHMQLTACPVRPRPRAPGPRPASRTLPSLWPLPLPPRSCPTTCRRSWAWVQLQLPPRAAPRPRVPPCPCPPARPPKSRPLFRGVIRPLPSLTAA
ncbi:TBC1 domain family member 17 isoform X2 [Monodelphis domestica]|uniref:TBC1 domain family member 17 isoform X2 n=1 Tax=Monodelphis domestica TaxID=13616 RepID=UPI0024E240CF|nr:TBC1 domain family member 17 isoform X2 [Monodelphis domestica]